MSDMYKPYVDDIYYFETYQGNVLKSDECQRYLKQASRHIDSLTYNRIVGQGFSNLTAFQQDVIREVICEQADFEYENAEVIETVLSSYSINGTAMQFTQSWNVHTDKGVAMRKDIYALLSQTGLCCRLAR